MKGVGSYVSVAVKPSTVLLGFVSGTSRALSAARSPEYPAVTSTYDGVADNHVQEGTGEVIVRYEIRTVSFVFLFPHTDCVDLIRVTASG